MKISFNSFFALYLLLSSITICAQQAIPACGGNAAGSGGSASYTVGQVTYSANINSNAEIAEGVQQSYQITEMESLQKSLSINLKMATYPNPATDMLFLSVNQTQMSGMYYRMYNINGSLVKEGAISDTTTNITMSDVQTGTYFLQVNQNNKELKTFQILKN